ncbi:MAG TPA: hypothetical protein VNR62_01375 [Cellulomonas sp.]|nr:hypothetical protein [Cellulomonas sp.]
MSTEPTPSTSRPDVLDDGEYAQVDEGKTIPHEPHHGGREGVLDDGEYAQVVEGDAPPASS